MRYSEASKASKSRWKYMKFVSLDLSKRLYSLFRAANRSANNFPKMRRKFPLDDLKKILYVFTEITPLLQPISKICWLYSSKNYITSQCFCLWCHHLTLALICVGSTCSDSCPHSIFSHTTAGVLIIECKWPPTPHCLPAERLALREVWIPLMQSPLSHPLMGVGGEVE